MEQINLYIESLILKDKIARLSRRAIELGWSGHGEQFDTVCSHLVDAEIALENIIRELGTD